VYGAVAGDIIGSPYEHRRVGSRDFPLFHPLSTWTDDTVLSLAVAQAILSDRPYGEVIRQFAQLYPDAGYGGSFLRWMQDEEAVPYECLCRMPARGNDEVRFPSSEHRGQHGRGDSVRDRSR
jgi:hypothetical protein